MEEKNTKNKSKKGESEEDNRNVDKLLEKNKERIEKLKEAAKEVIDPKKHDDIFLLRYCLSNADDKEAEVSLRTAIDYRKKNASWLDEALTKGEEAMPYR